MDPIVFNHEQTEDLLKHGHISGRGKAYADGTVGGGKHSLNLLSITLFYFSGQSNYEIR